MKKLFAILLAVMMIAALAVPALAADGDITITNVKKDAEYKAYKVFNVVKEGDDVFYTLLGSSLDNALLADGTPFYTYTKAGYAASYVAVKAGKTDEDVLDWLQSSTVSAAIKNTTPAATAKATSTGGSVTLATGGLGYYYIASSLGTHSAVIIDTPNTTKTIADKLMVPSIDPEGGKQVQNANVVDAQLGEELTFTVKFTATPQVEDEDGNAADVEKYFIYDYGTGLSNITLQTATAGGTDILSSVTKTDPADDTNGATVITIPWSAETYPTATEVVVTYTAKVTNTSASNTASIDWTTDENGEPDPPEDPPAGPTVTVYTHTIEILKVDGATKNAEGTYGTKLGGAEFYLKKTVDETVSWYKYTAATATADASVTWVSNRAEATKVITAEGTGLNAELTGLEAGTYTLVEVTAPTHYNIAEDTEVTIAAITNSEEAETTTNVTVEDFMGTTLPSTGGIGTTIFYVIGSIMILGAGVVLITKARVRKEED